MKVMEIQTVNINNKKIYIFDDVFSYHERTHFFHFLSNSLYKCTGNTSKSGPPDSMVAMQSAFSNEDFINFGLFDNLPEEIKKIISNYKATRYYSLITNWSVTNRFHVDRPSDLTFLYYANLKWDYDWGGETLFSNDKITEIVYTSMYKPGRIVIFDSSIPHRPIPTTSNCPNMRYTFVTNLTKDL